MLVVCQSERMGLQKCEVGIWCWYLKSDLGGGNDGRVSRVLGKRCDSVVAWAFSGW